MKKKAPTKEALLREKKRFEKDVQRVTGQTPEAITKLARKKR